MSFDGLFTYCMEKELRKNLLGGRVTKIYQPFKNELIVQVRANGKNHKVLFSAHPSFSRIHLTDETYDNPKEPPMFCMLLRKHLEGSVVDNIYQMNLERIIVFEMKSRNELGDISYKQLIIEIMGRHSNIILVDKERGMILDSIKHISQAVNRHRTVLPGHSYILPPAQHKLNPFEANEELLLKKLDFNAGKMAEQMVGQFAGISPLLANEIVYQAGLVNRNTLPKAFLDVVKKIKNLDTTPQMVWNEKKEFFYILPLTHLNGERKSFASISELLDRYYYQKADRDRVKQIGQDLERFIVNERKKNSNKIKKLQMTLNEAEKADQYKLFGELLTANMYAFNKGDQEVEVYNYYDENYPKMIIPLDPQKTPSENAQSYFQKYQKLKNSITIVQEQIEKAKEELEYFDRLMQQLEIASPKDLEEIREELLEEGYIKKKPSLNIRRKKDKPNLDQYISSDGTIILVGKNNKQNDYLTNKLANKEEIWLHTKDIPGSHVVIRNDNPSIETIQEAAVLAAYFSKARHSSSVPVDYTKLKHVKKPKGAKPGFVIYDHQQTVYVTPDEEMVLKLKASK